MGLELFRRRFMNYPRKHWTLFVILSLMVNLGIASTSQAQEKILMSYGGHNETVGPMWVAADRGLFKKYGLDVNMLQLRHGQGSLTAVMAGEVRAFWPAVSSVLSGVSGGAKLGCIASPFNRIAPGVSVRTGTT